MSLALSWLVASDLCSHHRYLWSYPQFRFRHQVVGGRLGVLSHVATSVSDMKIPTEGELQALCFSHLEAGFPRSLHSSCVKQSNAEQRNVR